MSTMSTQDALLEQVQRVLAGLPEHPTSPEVVRVIREQAGVISDEEVIAVLRRLRSESVGIGPLEAALTLPGVTDVLVNGPREVWIDRGGGLEHLDLDLGSEEAVRRLATRLALQCGRRLDDAQPFVDGCITRDDGSIIRIHAVLPPLADSGTCLSMRILRQASLTLDDLVAGGTLTADTAAVLRTIVAQRRAFLVVGGTGSGKTTLLAAMLGEVAHDQRIICIEDTAELNPAHPGTVNLVTRSANVEGAGAITMSDLLKQAMRMRPDRIVLGEIRGAEVVELLAALNTGHEGGAGTIHANSITEVPARMEALAALGGLNRDALHSQLAAALDVIIVMRHTTQGRRLTQLGVLRDNPVEAHVVWDWEHGLVDGDTEVATWFPR